MNRTYDEKDRGGGYALHEDDRLNREKGRSTAAVLIIVFGVMLTIAVYYVNVSLASFMLGLTLAAGGTASLVKAGKGRPDRRLLPTALITIGSIIAVNKIILYFLNSSGSYTVGQIKNIKGWLGFLLTIVAGSMILVFPFITDKLRKERCYLSVDAVCVGGYERQVGRGSMTIPLWEYSIYGDTYRNGGESWAYVGNPQIGDVREIMVDPDHPYDVYRKDEWSMIFGVLIGGLILGLSIFFTLRKFGMI